MDSSVQDQNFNIRLCKVVKKHPLIYNTDLKDYMNREAKERAWIEVGLEMNYDPKALKKKWKNFRTIFVRKRRDHKYGKYVDKPYYLYHHLEFLLPHLKKSYDEPGEPVKRPALKDKDQNDAEEAEDAVDETHSNHSMEEDIILQESDDNTDPIYYDEARVLQKKWQNFRTVFLRKLKQKQEGDHENSQYYLNQYLKFLLPYLKSPQLSRAQENPSIHAINTGDENDADDLLYETYSERDFAEANAIQETDDNEELTYYEDDIDTMLLNTPLKVERINSPDEVVSEDDANSEQQQNEANLKNKFTNKPTKLNTSWASSSTANRNKRKHLEVEVVEESDPKKQFLMSLLPDLSEMTNSQLRHFKSNVLLILEEILEDNST